MMVLHWKHGLKEKERERDVGIICVIIYDDLALEAWTQRRERERVCVCVCVCLCLVCVCMCVFAFICTVLIVYSLLVCGGQTISTRDYRRCSETPISARGCKVPS